MQKIIDGKRYNTETAESLAWLPCRAQSKSDFRYEDTQIYRTRKGRFFLAGEGGAMSRWSHFNGNTCGWGSGIQVLDADEAREYLERCGDDGRIALEKYFAIEDA